LTRNGVTRRVIDAVYKNVNITSSNMDNFW